MAVVVPVVEVRHHRFTTAPTYDELDRILVEQAQAGFGLIRIVPIDDEYSVAVFERTVPSDPKPPDKK